jgi:ketosteroid isomerase-like protein
MSMTNGIVRNPVAVNVKSRRRPLDAALFLLFPPFTRSLTRAVFRMSPRSRLRQAFLSRYLRVGLEAVNRGDLEAAFAVYHPNAVANFAEGLVSLGFDTAYMTREDRVAAERSWRAGWSEFRYEPEELTDLGDGRLLVFGRMRGRGGASGAVFDNEWSMILTISGGYVTHEQVFLDRAEALEAAGLSELTGATAESEGGIDR